MWRKTKTPPLYRAWLQTVLTVLHASAGFLHTTVAIDTALHFGVIPRNLYTAMQTGMMMLPDWIKN